MKTEARLFLSTSAPAAFLGFLIFAQLSPASAHELEEMYLAQPPGPENTNQPPVSASSNVHLLGRVDPFLGNNRYGDVWGEGNYAYIGSFGYETVAIVDISNPTAPKLAGVYDGGSNGWFEDMQVRNGIAYFASYHPNIPDGSGLHIVDVSNPASPVLLSRITPAEKGFNSIHNVFVDGDHLYEADAATPTIKVFNVKNPSAPVFVRDIRTTDSQFIHDMTVINNRLYTSGWSGRTDIYDVTGIDTTVPKRIGTVSTGTASHSSWVSADGKILVSCAEYNNKDLRIYDISDPARPVLRSTIASRTIGVDAVTPHNPVIMGDLLFVSWYQAGMQVFNIKDPANPLLVGAYDTFVGGVLAPGGVGVAPEQYDGCWGVYPLLGLNKVLLSDLDGGLFVVDATKLAGPDADGDRIPDSWELQHGLDPNNAEDGSLDSDQDGTSNVVEFLSGTDPKQKDSAGRLLSLQKNGLKVTVTFEAQPGRSYRVERNTRIAKTGWTLVQDEVQGVNGTASVIHTNANSNMLFYRVVVRP